MCITKHGYCGIIFCFYFLVCFSVVATKSKASYILGLLYQWTVIQTLFCTISDAKFLMKKVDDLLDTLDLLILVIIICPYFHVCWYVQAFSCKKFSFCFAFKPCFCKVFIFSISHQLPNMNSIQGDLIQYPLLNLNIAYCIILLYHQAQSTLWYRDLTYHPCKCLTIHKKIIVPLFYFRSLIF